MTQVLKKLLKTTCETHSIEKHKGKYVAKLLWREDSSELPTNQEIPKRKTETVICRLEKDPEMFRKYREIIAGQENRGVIQKLPIDNIACNNRIHYIPHHPLHKDSTNTPMRSVYNCSCRASRESPCLNNCLASYPPIMMDLTETLVRFRTHKYAFTADIEKVFFFLVELDPTERNVTRFF